MNLSQMPHRKVGARLLPALFVAFALVTAGPAALLAAAPKDRPAAPGRDSKSGSPQTTVGTTASTSGAGSDHGSGSTTGKATGHDKGTSEPGAGQR
nr:hypothetical protein [Actinomycetota bacterium]